MVEASKLEKTKDGNTINQRVSNQYVEDTHRKTKHTRSSARTYGLIQLHAPSFAVKNSSVSGKIRLFT